MRAAEKIGRRLARAANTAQSNYLMRPDIQLVTNSDYLAGNRVVTAALTKGRRPVFVVSFS